MDFSIEDRILSITKKNKVNLFFFKNSEEGYITIEKGIFYGNTDILKVIHEAKEQLRGYKNYGYIIGFTFCGLQLINNKGKTIYKNKHIFIPYMNTDWKTPKLRHSYNIKDASKYTIKQGGTYSDTADNVIIICRPNYGKDKTDTYVIFKSEKIKKQKLVGLPGTVKLRFNPKTNRYVDFNNPTVDLYPFEKHLK